MGTQNPRDASLTARPVDQAAAGTMPRDARRLYATALTAAQFDAGLTLLASIHAWDPGRPVLIYDLGLDKARRAFLVQLENVFLLGRDSVATCPTPRGGALRCTVLRALCDHLAPGAAVLWIDPDIALYGPLDSAFDRINAAGSFLVAAATGAGEIPQIDVTPGLFGLRAESKTAAMLDKCLDQDPAGDEAVLATFAGRPGAATAPAEGFVGTVHDTAEIGSQDIKKWFRRPARRLRRPAFNPAWPALRHFGIIKDFDGLRFSYHRKPACAVLGNGPSLADLDLSSFDGIDTIGLNAAFRHWRRIGWYPTLYCCLDLVVGMSLKDDILELVQKRRQLGIEQFLIRQNLFDWLLERDAIDGVVCFDMIRDGFDTLLSEPMTSGSHAAAWASVCGYDRLVLAGVDCNYVEQVPGAEQQDSIVLEIVSQEQNPNYFIPDYQQVGDRYLVPNPSEGMHVRSWRHLKDRLPERTLVVNSNPGSNVDAFPKLDIDRAKTLFNIDQQIDARPLVPFFARQTARTGQDAD